MIGASKILTVSYGTFSCTLEGFDDSFGTMKAIAEYFRDLAADDRYFGAEPPTPDADMLAKIAGREIKRQVEAKVEDNGVTLRPLEAVAAPTPITPSEPAVAAPVAAQAPEIIAEIAPETTPQTVVVPSFEYDDAQDEARAELGSPDAPATLSDALGGTESVAAKLRRIRAVVAKNQAADTTADTAAPIFTEETHADDLLPVMDAHTDIAHTEAAIDSPVEAPVAAAEIKDAPQQVDNIVSDVAAEAEADTDISALMSRVSDQAADVETDVQTDAAAYDEEYQAEADAPEEDNSLSNILDAVAKDSGADQQEAVAEAVEVEAEITEDIIAEDSSDTLDVAAEEIAQSIADIDAEALAAAEKDEAAQQPVKPVRPSRARVIKVKKANLRKGLVEVADLADQDPVADEPVLEHAPDGLGETNLSAEDEAELLAELADVELDTPVDSDIEADTDKGIDAAMRIERTARALHVAGGEDEASVSRLLDETNAQLDTDESTRRRSAISHLRAAVAATVADRKFAKPDETETPDQVDAYRTDLADVIRPQHATIKSDKHSDRPAPLILVSEQRIDHKKTAQSDAGPIRPRRILKSDVTLHEVEKTPHLGLADLALNTDTNDSADDKGTNIFADSTSFADFAEKMGATELPDLLEAAAAYTAYVEGRPHFARPQIMRQVAGFAGKDEFNREEGLRSFGQLLRQGKIIKTKRGQFEIAETTRFKPQARFAGE